MSEEKERIIDALEWSLRDIINAIPDIAEKGYTGVQTSPVQPHKEIMEQYRHDEWYKLFQPLGFSIGNDLGTKEDLIELCEVAHKYNVKIYVNTILNHMANLDGNHESEPAKEVDPILLENEGFWKDKNIIQNWEDRWQCVNWCNKLAALDLRNKDLEKIVVDFLNEMIDCGVDGFRLDALKHIMLPSEGSDFLNIFKEDANVLHNRENLTIYGELIHINDMNLLEQYIQCGIKPMINLSDIAYRFRDEGKTDQIYTFFESADSFLNKDDFGWSRKLDDKVILDNTYYLNKDFKNTIAYSRNYDFWKRIDLAK